MKLFHWKSNGVDLLIVSESPEVARTELFKNLAAWRWQNPPVIDEIIAAVKGGPYFIADPNYPITLGLLLPKRAS